MHYIGQGSRGVQSLARNPIATFATYQDAQQLVDQLSDKQFAVEKTAIVAEGLKFVEQVTGRLTLARAMLSGAATGAVVGLSIGFVLGFLQLIAPLVSAMVLGSYGLVAGAVIGAVVGLTSYLLSGGRRDFTSIGSLDAESYTVLVEDDAEEEARRLLLEPRSAVQGQR